MVRLLAFSILSLLALCHAYNTQPRIINGYLNEFNNFPFYVFVDGDDSRCGASLLSDRWILTAAHCIAHQEEITVYLGSISVGQFSHKSIVPFFNQYIHPLYDEETISHDIALIELATPIEFNQYIQPVNLTNNCVTPHKGGEFAQAAGTGQFIKDKITTDYILRYALLVTITSESCSSWTVYKNDPNTIICAFENFYTGQAGYKGDSGGPLVGQTDGKLIGVMSSAVTIENDEHTVLQIFLNVPYYYGWIENVTGLKMPKC